MELSLSLSLFPRKRFVFRECAPHPSLLLPSSPSKTLSTTTTLTTTKKQPALQEELLRGRGRCRRPPHRVGSRTRHGQGMGRLAARLRRGRPARPGRARDCARRRALLWGGLPAPALEGAARVHRRLRLVHLGRVLLSRVGLHPRGGGEDPEGRGYAAEDAGDRRRLAVHRRRPLVLEEAAAAPARPGLRPRRRRGLLRARLVRVSVGVLVTPVAAAASPSSRSRRRRRAGQGRGGRLDPARVGRARRRVLRLF